MQYDSLKEKIRDIYKDILTDEPENDIDINNHLKVRLPKEVMIQCSSDALSSQYMEEISRLWSKRMNLSDE